MTTREEILASRARAIAAFAKSALVALEQGDAHSALGDVKLILSLAEEPPYVATEATYREATEQQLRRPQ